MEKSAVIFYHLQCNVAAPRSPQTILPQMDSNSFLFIAVSSAEYPTHLQLYLTDKYTVHSVR